MSINQSRRRFLVLAATGTAGMVLCTGAGAAADLPHLSPDDPTAKALGYVEDAAKINPAAEATFKKGSACASCALYQADKAKGGYGPCGAFAGKAVNAKGWCRAYSAKA